MVRIEALRSFLPAVFKNLHFHSSPPYNRPKSTPFYPPQHQAHFPLLFARYCHGCGKIPGAWNLSVLSHKVVEEAKRQFAANPYGKEIVCQIQEQLAHYKKTGHVILERIPVGFSDAENRKFQEIAKSIEIFFNRKDLFYSIPIINLRKRYNETI